MLCLAGSASARTLVVSNMYGDEGLYAFTLDKQTGVPSLVSPSPATAGTAPTVPSISPDGQFAYVADFSGDTLHSLEFDGEVPTPVPGGTAATGTGPNATVVSPDGGAAWTANYGAGSVSQFGLAAATPIPDGNVTAANGSASVAVSPRNNFVYVANPGDDTVSGFVRTPGSSILTPLSWSPRPTAGEPTDVEFSVDGRHLFVTRSSDDEVASFRIDASDGSLSEIGAAPTCDHPVALAASPDGRWLAVVNNFDSTLGVYAVSSGGTLAETDCDVSTGGAAPWDVAFSPDSRFVYTPNYYSNSLAAFAVDSDGLADPLSGSPYTVAAGGFPFSLAIQPNQGPTASFAQSPETLTVGFDAGASTDTDGTVANYHWNFGDGVTVTTNSPQATHRYPNYGSYTASLTVVDNEGCSDRQIGTGQTLACNGGAKAVASQTVTISAPTPPPPPPVTPLVLNRVSAAQVFKSGSSTRRIRVRYSLTDPAALTLRFYRRNSRGSFKRFGGEIKKSGRSNANSFHIVNRIGGRRIEAGRYRVKIYAKAGSQQTPWRSAVFSVR